MADENCTLAALLETELRPGLFEPGAAEALRPNWPPREEVAMYGRGKRVLLREYLDQGLSKAELAERLGISRSTIYHWIRTGQLDRDLDDERVRYAPRPPVTCKIDPYRGVIQSRLDEFPKLSAVRLYEEIRQSGYTGGYTQVKEFVRSVRAQPHVEPIQRFETPPGHQAQVDFAQFRLPWGTRYALLVVLGYSRLLWLRFFERQTMEVLFAGLEEAFGAFGGVPREILFDQMRAVISADHRFEGGGLVTNPEFARFAHHWRFRPRACRPYRAQTKGKVERPIRYVRDRFFYGRDFANDADLNDQVGIWLEQTANVRCHATLKQRPIDRFEWDERAVLQPLAPRPYTRLQASSKPAAPSSPQIPRSIQVEQRSLQVYDRLAEVR